LKTRILVFVFLLETGSKFFCSLGTIDRVVVGGSMLRLFLSDLSTAEDDEDSTDFDCATDDAEDDDEAILIPEGTFRM
jgi:hypothetical protein